MEALTLGYWKNAVGELPFGYSFILGTYSYGRYFLELAYSGFGWGKVRCVRRERTSAVLCSVLIAREDKKGKMRFANEKGVARYVQRQVRQTEVELKFQRKRG